MKIAPALFRSLFFSSLLLAAANCTAPVAGAPCPCAVGFTCDEEQDTCVTASVPGESLCPRGVLTVIEDNHEDTPWGDPAAHSIEITESQILDAVQVEYDIQGDADHEHVFFLSPGTFEEIQREGVGGVITGGANGHESGHSHLIMIYCHENPPDREPTIDGGLPEEQ